MSQQRTLLPYRLARDWAAAEILEQFEWCDEYHALAQLAIDSIVVHPGSEELRASLLGLLNHCCNEDVAGVLVEDLVEEAKKVWLFEREFQFPLGFALIPISRSGVSAERRQLIGGAA